MTPKENHFGRGVENKIEQIPNQEKIGEYVDRVLGEQKRLELGMHRDCRLSVVVPALQERENIVPMIKSFLEQTGVSFKDFEVIAVVNNDKEAATGKTEVFLDNQQTLRIIRAISDKNASLDNLNLSQEEKKVNSLLSEWAGEALKNLELKVVDDKIKFLSAYFNEQDCSDGEFYFINDKLSENREVKELIMELGINMMVFAKMPFSETDKVEYEKYKQEEGKVFRQLSDILSFLEEKKEPEKKELEFKRR
ncbi:MAG: hypothetical protein GF335_03530 [Candidatus Moranbacteria bacterium]|nr:hypothetical protein [Candidatus Moranbacteria bacterium]